MTTSREELIKLYAKQLKVSTFSQYKELILEAQRDGWCYEEFLYQLMKAEVEKRQQNQLKWRIKAAGFPVIKTLDTFETGHLMHVEPATIWQLATGEYIKRRENIIMVGNPGTGKTHLSIGLGIAACRDGYRVRFYSAPALATELAEAQDKYQLRRIEQAINKAELLIIDDLSYITFSRRHSELLFKLIAERTERSSIIISTNLEFSRWTELFDDPMLTAALVDRLTFKAHILNMNGESYRLKHRQPSKE